MEALPKGIGGFHLNVSFTSAFKYGKCGRSSAPGNRLDPTTLSISACAFLWMDGLSIMTRKKVFIIEIVCSENQENIDDVSKLWLTVSVPARYNEIAECFIIDSSQGSGFELSFSSKSAVYDLDAVPFFYNPHQSANVI